jgi:hypothetical protein
MRRLDAVASARSLVALVAFACCLFGLPDDAEAGSGTHFRVEGVANVPIQLGVGGVLELPAGIRAGGSIGYLPTSFVGVANDIIVPMTDKYSEEDAGLVEQTVGDSLAWRLYGGWSPPLLGLYFHGGYSMTTFGGSAPSAALLGSITNNDFPEGRGGRSPSSGSFEASSTLHQLFIGVGWDFKLGPIALRLGAGWSYTFASSANLEANFEPRREPVQRVVDEIEKDGEEYLQKTYNKYLHPPWATVAVGWKFF